MSGDPGNASPTTVNVTALYGVALRLNHDDRIAVHRCTVEPRHVDVTDDGRGKDTAAAARSGTSSASSVRNCASSHDSAACTVWRRTKPCIRTS